MIFGKQLIKTFLQDKMGLEVHRFAPDSSFTAQLVYSLANFNVDVVLDVGANQGQFAQKIRSGGYKRDILSFEPLSSAHSALQQVSKDDALWRVYPRCALGDYCGNVEINIAGNSASSSLLPMLDSHLSAAPYTAYIGKESVPILTLDSVAGDCLAKFKNPFLKIDTQGFEWQVLNGAQNVLSNMRGVLLELSLIPLYDGQHLWQEMIGRLEQAGFTLWCLQPGFTDPHNGRTFQIDGVFYRV